mmetsp:Transcript_31106/g.68177  ORF Transcript_31106/g.68177 Transcript_31106/m.68177 type:complete len:248 (-) Transcript_31106:637-1380(-)
MDALRAYSARKTSQRRASRGRRKRSARVCTSSVNLASRRTSSSRMSETRDGGDVGSKWSVWRKCSSAWSASPDTSSPRSMGPPPFEASRIPPESIERKYALLASRIRPSARYTRRSLPAVNSTCTLAPLAPVQSTRRMSEQKVDSRVSMVSAVKIRNGTEKMRNIIRPSGVTPYVSIDDGSTPLMCRVETSNVSRSTRQNLLSLSRTYAKRRVSTGRLRCVNLASVPNPSRLPDAFGCPAMHSTVRS